MKPGEDDERAGQLHADADAVLLDDQREANERLVLATIYAQELTEEAESARQSAEECSRKAEVAKDAAQALARHLAITERDLRATAEFREQLLAIVGHDLRSPLGAIAGSAELLESTADLDERGVRLVGRIRGSAARMTRMIEQLLEFTRARLGGGLPLERKPVGLRDICRQVIEELEVATHVEIATELDGSLTGSWDADRLAEVLSNIAANAIDHAASGSRITIAAREDDADVFLEIRNQGEPIPAEVFPILFEPFRRAKQRDPSRSGHLGLGLYIAYQIVKAHGGDLQARSAGGITTFSIRLPKSARSRQ